MIEKLFPEYILKYGTTGIMAVWLFTMNMRLSDVESRLYDCLGSKRASVVIPERVHNPNAQLAILPNNDFKIQIEDEK